MSVRSAWRRGSRRRSWLRCPAPTDGAEDRGRQPEYPRTTLRRIRTAIGCRFEDLLGYGGRSWRLAALTGPRDGEFQGKKTPIFRGVGPPQTGGYFLMHWLGTNVRVMPKLQSQPTITPNKIYPMGNAGSSKATGYSLTPKKQVPPSGGRGGALGESNGSDSCDQALRDKCVPTISPFPAKAERPIWSAEIAV